MTPLPLRTSLTAFYTAMLALLVTAAGLSYHSALVHHLDDEATENLDDKVRRLLGCLRFEQGVPVLVYNREDAEEVALIEDATQYYQVYDANGGRLLAQSPGLESLGLQYTTGEVAELRANPAQRDVQTDRGRIRLSTRVVAPTTHEAYVVQVGELLNRVDKVLAGFERLLLWRIVAGLLCAALVGRWLAGRALKPLSRLAEATQTIGITNLHERLSLRGAQDELDQVASAFNRTLARVEGSVGEMRQFSAALAHELRTPLAILRGEAELALRGASSAEELRQVLAGQVDEFDRVTRLINQILTLARAEAGEVPIAEAPVDIAAVATSVVEQIEPVAAARDITLTSAVSAPARVKGDAGWLGRLLLILLDNAIKFTPDGGRVSVTLTQADGFVLVAVIDSGIGITPDARPHLFERFYRGDAARGRQTEGAGLGLALARWIADRHHATITVASEPGEGSTFTVRLPALAEADAASA